MNPFRDPSGSEERRDPMPESVVDAYFDGDMDDACERAMMDGLRRDADAAHTFAMTMWMVEGLRRPVSSPDLAGRVLDEVHRRRAWMAPKQRRFVQFGRLAAAAALLGLLTVTLIARRESPAAMMATSGPAPLSNFVNAGAAEATDTIRTIESAMTLRTAIATAGQASWLPSGMVLSNDEPAPMRTVAFVVPVELPAEIPGQPRIAACYAGDSAIPSCLSPRPTIKAADGLRWPRQESMRTEVARLKLIPGG